MRHSQLLAAIVSGIAILSVAGTVMLDWWHPSEGWTQQLWKNVGPMEKRLASPAWVAAFAVAMGILGHWLGATFSLVPRLLPRLACLVSCLFLALTFSGSLATVGILFQPMAGMAAAILGALLGALMLRKKHQRRRQLDILGLTGRVSQTRLGRFMEAKGSPEFADGCYDVSLVTLAVSGITVPNEISTEAVEQNSSIEGFLDERLHEAAAALLDQGGYLKNLTQSGLQVYFGLPKKNKRYASLACRAALSISEKAHLSVVSGSIAALTDFAGDKTTEDQLGPIYAVNGVSIDQQTTDLLDRNEDIVRPIGFLIHQEEGHHQYLGRKEDLSDEVIEQVGHFSKGAEALADGRHEEARACFKKCPKEDPVVKQALELCQPSSKPKKRARSRS